MLKRYMCTCNHYHDVELDHNNVIGALYPCRAFMNSEPCPCQGFTSIDSTIKAGVVVTQDGRVSLSQDMSRIYYCTCNHWHRVSLDHDSVIQYIASCDMDCSCPGFKGRDIDVRVWTRVNKDGMVIDTPGKAADAPDIAGKRDSTMPRYGDIPLDFMRELALVYTEGASHYGVGNWKLGLNVQDVFNHMTEHLLHWKDGYDTKGFTPSEDTPNEIRELAKVAWGAATIIWYYQNRRDVYDGFRGK